MAKRKRVTMLITVTAPAKMRTSAVWREVRTRIDDVSAHYSGHEFNLEDRRGYTPAGGEIRVTVAKMKPMREDATDA